MDHRFEKCMNGNHKFEVVNEISTPGNIDEITEWCNVCGCITTIQMSDGRFIGRSMELKGPAVYKLYQKSEHDLRIKNIRSDWRL